MQIEQLDIFTAALPHQNNKESQLQIEDNMHHFSRQAKLVFDHLMSGRTLTHDEAMSYYKIRDLRARIYTIKNAGYKVDETTIPNSHGMKRWHMSKHLIEFNKNLNK
jgi:hypothetical protein